MSYDRKRLRHLCSLFNFPSQIHFANSQFGVPVFTKTCNTSNSKDFLYSIDFIIFSSLIYFEYKFRRRKSVNRPPTPDVAEDQEKEPTLQELINIKVGFFFNFFLDWLIVFNLLVFPFRSFWLKYIQCGVWYSWLRVERKRD